MSRFPHLPETFILREMTELEKHDLDIFLFPLIKQDSKIIHQEAQKWIKKAQFTPYISRQILESNIRIFLSRPQKYFTIFVKMVYLNLTSLNFLLRSLALFPKSIYFAEIAEEQNIEHFHAHYATHPALVAWIIMNITGISYSVTVHAHDIFVRKTMLAEKLKNAQFIIAISEFNKDYLVEKIYPTLAEKTHVIHCGIRPETYSGDMSSSPDNRSEFELISIGSLQKYKGQIYLIEACEQLMKSGIPFHCHIIGEGEERSVLENLISRFGLSSYVTLHGGLPQEQVAQYLQRGDCYIQPSIIAPNKKMEGIPVSIMEAMASNLPVVATKISGIPELVRHQLTGLLVNEKNAKELAEAIVFLYQNPNKAKEFARKGRELVKTEFNLVENTKKIYALFLCS